MNPRQLREFKELNKELKEFPKFFAGTHGKDYPKPMKQLRKYDMVSDILEVANNHIVVFAYRRKPLSIDCKFYAYWGLKNSDGKLIPIMIMHYHPDHKGIHVKLPCKTDPNIDFTSRELPGAPELNIYGKESPDIRTDEGVKQLVNLFCSASGTSIKEQIVFQESLF